jgi:hypothetical protein
VVRESLGERWLVTISEYKAGWPIRKLFTERVAPRPGVADMLVEINDEQRRGWFLSYFARLWCGRSVRSRYHL